MDIPKEIESGISILIGPNVVKIVLAKTIINLITNKLSVLDNIG